MWSLLWFRYDSYRGSPNRKKYPSWTETKLCRRKWPNIATVEWQRAREEAYDLARFNEPLDIRGTDIDPAVLSLARYHFNQAGIQDGIHWQRQDFRDFSNRYKYGYIITNPPYGHRLGEIKEAEQIYKDLRPILAPLDTWSYFILTSHKDFERLFGRQATKRRKLYNGRIECHYYQYLDRGHQGRINSFQEFSRIIRLTFK